MKEIDLIKVAAKATKGEITEEQAHAIFQVNSGKEGVFKTGNELPVLDVKGKPLVIGKRYREPKRNNRVILIKDATFGQGNIMNTYYRVWHYSGEEMKESFSVVEGRGCIFSGFSYRSNFEPLDESPIS